ncbi:MAG: helix-turn-helix domain-containing protein [Oscillospiraceae bacterium]
MYVDYKLLGKRIAARRRELGLKQYQVNERAGLSDKYISCIETAKSIPSIDVLMRICDALETTPDHLLLGTVSDTESESFDRQISERISELDTESKKFIMDILELTVKYKGRSAGQALEKTKK